jgi:hypothetical protein
MIVPRNWSPGCSFILSVCQSQHSRWSTCIEHMCVFIQSNDSSGKHQIRRTEWQVGIRVLIFSKWCVPWYLSQVRFITTLSTAFQIAQARVQNTESTLKTTLKYVTISRCEPSLLPQRKLLFNYRYLAQNDTRNPYEPGPPPQPVYSP